MKIRIPVKDKKPGIRCAVTDEGLELPVIDITHPSFSLDQDPGEWEALAGPFFRESKKFEEAPAFLQRLILGTLGFNSVFLRGMAGIRKNGFLDATTTYLMKLGSGHLGSYASGTDRRIAESLSGLCIRQRLRNGARLLADGLAPLLAARSSEPLHLLNIGGGPCADSWNALLLLRREQARELLDRPLHIHCLDLGEEGFRFGERAVRALQSGGGPLEGLDLELNYAAYDWRKPEALSRFLAGLGPEALVAASSEGALLDYGSDGEVAANLEALARGSRAGLFLVGSATRDHEAIRPGNLRFFLHPRNPDALEALVRGAGWTLDRRLGTPLSFNVLLRPR